MLSRFWYRFGSRRHRGQWFVVIRMPISTLHVIYTQREVVECDVPFLLGLYKPTALKAIVYLGKDVLSSRVNRWSISFTRKRGPVYVERPSEIMYKGRELRHTHRHFKHHHTKKNSTRYRSEQTQKPCITLRILPWRIFTTPVTFVKGILTSRAGSGYHFLTKTACSIG